MSITVVVPCYNEEKTIGRVVEALRAQEGITEIIVVDNNCTDTTVLIAQDLGARVVGQKVPGYGAAIKKGLSKAKGDILAVLDGDDQYPADRVQEFASLLETERLDFISCTRFPLKDKNSMPIIRRVGNKIFNLFTNVLFGLHLRDSQSGMWIFKRQVLDRILLESDSMPLSEEFKIKVAKDEKLKFVEKAIDYKERLGDSKLLPFKHGLVNLWFLFKLKFKMAWKEKSSLIFFAALVALSAIYLSLSFYNIKEPFIHVTADVNGLNGMAAANLLKYGPLKLHFGVHDNMMLAKDVEASSGNFYVHHPQFYVWPTILFYKLFGISEMTTRLGPLSYMYLAWLFFAFALRKVFKDIWPALLSLLVFSILPGLIFYGKAFELAVFSLPSGIISWSLFVFYAETKKKAYLGWFLVSLITGGLMGWFFYLLPPFIWLSLLLVKKFRTLPYRKTLLLLIPLILATVFVGNLMHFNLLNGEGAYKDAFSAFKSRASRQPFGPWWNRISWLIYLHTTWIFAISSLGGVGLWVYGLIKKKEDLYYLLPLLLWPILVFAIFFQWSTHPFGVIFLLPTVAVFCGYLLAVCLCSRKNRFYLISLAVLIIGFGSWLSWANQKYFYDKFLILTKQDIDLPRQLKNQVQDREICMGPNEMGISFRGIADFYLQKKTTVYPECVQYPDQAKALKALFIFNPKLGKYYQDSYDELKSKGFEITGCANFWCLASKK